MRNFQIIILVVFIAMAVFGVLVFAGVVKIGQDEDTGPTGRVTIWGTFKSDLINPLITTFNEQNKNLVIRYVAKDPDTFNEELLEAFASGTGPDMFFITDELIFNYLNKIYVIPYTSYPLESFQGAFASVGEVFTNSKGVIAFPLAIDPLIMYYNRNILDANAIVSPPQYWDEFAGLAPKLTKRDESKILKTVAGFGQYSNVTNAKGILSTLFMQSGNKIVVESKNSFQSTLATDEKGRPSNLGPVLKFYLNFTDPLQEVYSWNRSMPQSKDFFVADNSAFYFGYASELGSMISKNPNLNFRVATVPQVKNAGFKLTKGKVIGIAVSNFSKNQNTAFAISSYMASTDFALKLADALGMAPARRDLLAKKLSSDAYMPTIYTSALFAKSWLDPDPEGTDSIFRSMVDNVLANNLDANTSVQDAGGKIRLLLLK